LNYLVQIFHKTFLINIFIKYLLCTFIIMSDFYLWTETVNFNLSAWPGDPNPGAKTATVVKYKTTGVLDLGGVTFVITPGSGTFPDVTNNCNSQTFQGSQFLHFNAPMSTGVPVTADIYGQVGNLWGLCSGNSATNIITLAGDTGLQSSTNGTNVLAYLYDDDFTISSISSVSNSSGQSYGSNGWSFQMGDPTAVSDSTPPVITLTGDATVNLNTGDNYTDAGAAATDETDASVAVTVSGSVNPAAAGTYTLTYSAQDAAGNQATPVIRTVIVSAPADSTDPVINLNGPSSSNHEVGPPYTDTATASDNADGNITSSMTTTITKDGAVFGDDVSTIGYVTGTYVITYNVSDDAGNAATPVTRTVTVADTLDPTMELQGDATVAITVGQSYSDAGVIPGDNYDQSPTISITITKNDAAFNDDITTIGNAIGTYVITYTASDAAGNTATPVTRTVNVEAAPDDTTAPVISLTGASTITLTVGEAYTEYGATATDTVDGTVTVTIGGDTVDTGVAGIYIITYNATDAAQNAATQVTRTVNVEAAPVADTTDPVINLNGASTITLTVGQTYTELVSATDNVDGTVQVTIGGTVDTGVAGTYTLTYDATDAAQNAATQVTRTVTVEAATDTTWGDITNDGSIGAADVVYLASYLAGESGFIHGGPSAPAS
jgi:hypothetical protein